MIPISKPCLGKEELALVTDCINSGWISSQGKYVKMFEELFANWVGCKHGVATSSGTTALHLALTTLGIGKGDRVIVPVLTFIATANVVKYCGAEPVFVDVSRDDWCLDVKQVKELVWQKSNHIKAIIPVHLYGHPVKMDAIMKLAMEYDLAVVEDCAEAIGATYKGEVVGCMSHISAFSFFANKVISTGEGGMCLTNSEADYKLMRALRDHGRLDASKNYEHQLIGFNYRMTNLQAAVGVAQMSKIDKFLAERERIRNVYDAMLPVGFERMPLNPSWASPVNWTYTCLLPKGIGRDGIIAEMAKEGIETRPIFYPLTKMLPYKSDKSFPIAEDISARGISLPTYPELTDEQVKYVCDVLRSKL